MAYTIKNKPAKEKKKDKYLYRQYFDEGYSDWYEYKDKEGNKHTYQKTIRFTK